MFRKLSRLEILSNPEARRRELAEDSQEGALRVAEQGGRCLRGVVLILNFSVPCVGQSGVGPGAAGDVLARGGPAH